MLLNHIVAILTDDQINFIADVMQAHFDRSLTEIAEEDERARSLFTELNMI